MPVKNHMHEYGDWEKAGLLDPTLVRYCQRRKCSKRQIKWQHGPEIIKPEDLNKPYKFYAKFTSTCVYCATTIKKGNLVWKTNKGVKHFICPPTKRRGR